jgi:hypothetical protein
MSAKATLLWFGALTLFAVVSRAQVRGASGDRCSFDGATIEPIHRVDLMQDGTTCASFCSIACARAWPAPPPRSSWQLRDEVSGRPVDASRACFVESRIVTVAARHERIHVFLDPSDAMNHCVQFGGARIQDPLIPPAAGESDH